MADLIPYPYPDYNCYGSLDLAENYFENRLRSEIFFRSNDDVQSAALITAFYSLGELNLNVDLENDEKALAKLVQANFEQALYELQNDQDIQQAIFLNLSGLAIKMR